MLNIGEFSGITGLSVKALRHYDEKRVLAPSAIDEASGYRKYAEHQVREGVIIRALRDAGVPLAEVATIQATAEAPGADAALLLAAHRDRVAAERLREDLAYEAATQIIAALGVPTNVIERACAPQPFVARKVHVPAEPERVKELDDANELAGEQFAELFGLLQGDGLSPSGQFWTTLGPANHGTVELMCCWPTPTRLMTDWGGPETIVDELPARTELVATWHATDGPELPEGATHPAVVALFDHVSEREVSLRNAEVRQSVIGASEHDYAVEVAITIR
ncbi:MerR family transcriptional regulator [Lysinibacter cavernae]|uniref:DNA-binding transcriptional MerR regulator n=1 Tax=Lysinibacter cavernae TaxID=1640652 RepID=A0A7X5TSP7_9MICO|nr:MerR family transcriptional regulator [Lysinibacter cavernae]NIH53275.1 DNA-binding transcriptional MerR regulator [Lysinibacter cavernae]